MTKLIQYLKPLVALLFVAVALLGIQTVCDLSPEEFEKYFPNTAIIMRILSLCHQSPDKRGISGAETH